MSPWAWLGIAIIVMVVVGAGIWLSVRPAVAPVVTAQPSVAVLQETPAAGAPQLPIAQEAPDTSPAAFQIQTFTETKSPHFVSARPANNAALTTAPTEVTIMFNFDVVPPSTVRVTLDGADVTAGPAVIAADRLSMSVPVTANQTGNYQVAYTACWPDQSCHNGSYGFSIQLAP